MLSTKYTEIDGFTCKELLSKPTMEQDPTHMLRGMFACEGNTDFVAVVCVVNKFTDPVNLRSGISSSLFLWEPMRAKNVFPSLSPLPLPLPPKKNAWSLFLDTVALWRLVSRFELMRTMLSILCLIYCTELIGLQRISHILTFFYLLKQLSCSSQMKTVKYNVSWSFNLPVKTLLALSIS